MMKLFLRFECEKFLKFFKTKTLAKVITTVLFLIVFAFVGMGIYVFFLSGFRYINVEAVDDIKLALTLFIYELFLLVLAAIIIFSAMVSGVFNLFKGETNAWIISSPSYKIFPKVIFIKSCVNAMLPTVVMFLPAVIAFTKIYHLGTLAIISIVLSSIILIILLSAITLLGITGLGFLYYTLAKRTKLFRFTLRGMIVMLISVIIIGLGITWGLVRDVDLVKMFRAENVDAAIAISTISSHFMIFPTHIFAMEILNWQSGNTGAALADLGLLLGITGVFVALWWRYSRFFYPLWQILQEGTSQLSGSKSTSLLGRTTYHFNGGVTMALFKKEMLVFSRNFKGVLWFLFLLFIWVLQIGANRILGHNIERYQPDISQKIILLQTIQYIIAIYFISSFTLRFAFPSFSVERKTSWITGTAPVSFRKLFFGKYVFYTLTFLIVALVMGYSNSAVIGLSLVAASYGLLLLSSVVVFIVTLGLFIGVLYPNTETDDPEVISTSMPGLFFTALALLYGALSDMILYRSLLSNNSEILLLFVGITFVGIFLMVYLISTSGSTRKMLTE